jgi:multidrug resistance efflux pump
LASACRNSEGTAAADPPRIELKAVVAPLDSVTVVAPIEGRVSQLRVTEGAVVRAGDVLFTLLNPTVARDLAYARSAVVATDLRRRGTSAPKAPAPTRMSTDRAGLARDIVHEREQKLARMRRLLADGDVAKQEVENAEAELAIAQRDLNAELERQQVAPAVAASTPPALLQAETERARADLALAEHRQSLLTVTAPTGGTIAHLRVTQGGDVYTRDPIAEIVAGSSVHVQAPIAPELLSYVRVGMPVDVKLMTIPARRFREPITRILQPGGDGGAAVIVDIPNPDRMLQPGTAAVITIQ